MTDSNQSDPSKPITAVARWLGYSGLIPFIVLSLCCALGVELQWFGTMNTVQALLVYGALIVTFIGAVHWGLALSNTTVNSSNAHYLYSVIPSLVAWGLLFLPLKASLYGMALVLVVLYLVDRTMLSSFQNTGYLTLRLHLTIVAGLSLAMAAFTAGNS